MGKPANIADLARLEDEIHEALINLIDKPTNSVTLADLKRRQLHLKDQIEWLLHEAAENGRPN